MWPRACAAQRVAARCSWARRPFEPRGGSRTSPAAAGACTVCATCQSPSPRALSRRHRSRTEPPGAVGSAHMTGDFAAVFPPRRLDRARCARGQRTILKLAPAPRPVLPPAVGVATSLYLPGARVLPLRRPVKRNVFVPVSPVRMNLPFSVTKRLHRFRFAFFLVARSQVVLLPCLTFLPILGRCTVKRTLAGSSSV